MRSDDPLALGLAATWPSDRQVLLVEADPAGGTVAASSGWAPEPGLVSLAAAARRGGDPTMVWDHCQHLLGGAAVLAGRALADQAQGVIGMLGPFMARLGGWTPTCSSTADASTLPGLRPGSGAERRVLGRPRLPDLQALATWLDAGASDQGRAGLVILAEAEPLGRIVGQALRRGRLCSSDPMCPEHLPSANEGTLHGAACHACLFAPETSCERSNRYLDRAALAVKTFAEAGLTLLPA